MNSSDMIEICCSESNMLIDLSYFVFYRYYATLSWFKRYMQNEVSIQDIMINKEFVDKYSKLFENTLAELVRVHAIKWSNVFLVKDCMRETIWRNAHFAEYKAGRDERPDSFNRDVFRFTYNELLPKLEEKYKFKIITHQKLEADEVIAVLKKAIRGINDSRIVIITNDNDYIQLIDDTTQIINLQGKNICERVNMSPSLYLKYKVIIGDKSDNIPCIMKKVGPKTSEKLAQDDSSLIEFCKKHPEALKQFELNRLLIDFSYIPEEFTSSLLEKLILKNI